MGKKIHYHKSVFQGAAIFIMFFIWSHCYGQPGSVRDRGESYLGCRTSNTTSFGDIWLSFGGVGHVWDKHPSLLDSVSKDQLKWYSNARFFPEFRVHAGLFSFGMITIESRPVSWSLEPGWVSGELKLTMPQNDHLRFVGIGYSLRYAHHFWDGPPTIGGYRGFTPEGYITEGGRIENRLLLELDFLAHKGRLPIRFITNLGLRVPTDRELWSSSQLLLDVGVVYNAHAYDLFFQYSLEAFRNFLEPKVFTMNDSQKHSKRWLVYFTENMSYLSLGGNVRFPKGSMFSISIPMLLSVNQQSSISIHHQELLDRKSGAFPDEEKRGIRDPFDPWFVKWKIVTTVTVPIRFKSSNSELIRSHLLYQNRNKPNRINFDEFIRELNK
ncbi:hypothetical protein QA601_00835 [Chitinispirillales bacterium ANBcel5]|uniref:hypothetical protein n=1 Tax=Cellulosispirillum alkaliphilum TaxID=3039283 RepID=UPI002A50EFF5|nr:hypothetical protein [Chitinispirillales bacterium ANBcel5]